MDLPKLTTDGPNIISAECVDRVMVAAALTAEHAALIVRAVNTFDQAKAALKELIGDLDDYWNQQNDDCSPVSSATIIRARQALAAMEAS